jgi:hypothetical protein
VLSRTEPVGELRTLARARAPSHPHAPSRSTGVLDLLVADAISASAPVLLDIDLPDGRSVRALVPESGELLVPDLPEGALKVRLAPIGGGQNVGSTPDPEAAAPSAPDGPASTS